MHEHRQMHLNCHIVGVGQHPAGWRTLRNTRAIVDPDFYRRVARVAEQGKFDALFFSDSLSLHGHAHGPSQMLDPLVVASALALVTERIGLICTASTTFSDPFSLARRFLSLDQMSGGRAGWNAVTTYNPAAAANFGQVALPSAAERYARADEFIDVTIKLWESWGERALVADAASGVFADPAQVRRIDHHGRHFDIAGPLNVPRSPQGRPLLVQAGASEAGLELAARHADMVFTSQHSLEGAQRFYADLKSRVHAKGRDPDQFGILPGLYPVIGSTMAEARARKDEMDALRDPGGDIEMLARQFGIRPEELALDAPLPYERIARASRDHVSHGFAAQMIGFARGKNLTVRELIDHNLGMHRIVVGTPESIADDMTQWFEQGAADGFNLNFDVFPDGLQTMVEHVVPLLQKRGLFRSDYSARTLKGHLGVRS